MEPVRLFCLPYAGGGASIYREWESRLPDWMQAVALNMPARGQRQAMPPVAQWEPLLDLLVRDIRPLLDRPYAVFGHSMGALIGLELAHRLRHETGVSPLWFGASACIAPARRVWDASWLTRTRSEVVDEMRKLKGTAVELLNNTEFMDMIWPMLRADFHLCGTHRPPPRHALDCPFSVLAGSDDTEVGGDPENLQAWSGETTGRLDVVMLDAGHFFINTHRDEVIAAVVRGLQEAVVRRNAMAAAEMTVSRSCAPLPLERIPSGD